MTSSAHQQETEEQAIFKLFIEASGLPVRLNTVRSGDIGKREPDIVCELAGEGCVGFELVEIITQQLRRETENGRQLRQTLEEASQRIPGFHDRYMTTSIYLGFPSKAPLAQRKRLVPAILQFLMGLPADQEKAIRLPKELRETMLEIAIHRGVKDGPGWDVVEAIERDDEMLVRLIRKLEGDYTTSFPVEVLGYFSLTSSRLDKEFASSLRTELTARLLKSTIRRVWIYDYFSRSVIFVYPEK